jgi:hypothetical protein
VPGATAEAGPVDNRERAIIGVGYQGFLNFTLPAGFDFFTNGACKLTQPQVYSVTAQAVLGLEIIGANVTQFGVFGQATSNFNLNIQCNQSASNHNFTIAAIVSPIYVEYIGGVVPLVYQFGLAGIGGIETDSLDTTVNARLVDEFEAGLGWQSGVGWGPFATHRAVQHEFSARGNGKAKVRLGPAFALSMYASVAFDVFNWVEIGFGIGATGVVYALPFLESNSTADLETGSGSATLHAGMESAAAAGIVIDLSTFLFGWEVFSESWRWIYQLVFPTIRYQLASITF